MMGREGGEGERRGKGRRGKGRAPMTLWHGASQCLNPALPVIVVYFDTFHTFRTVIVNAFGPIGLF